MFKSIRKFFIICRNGFRLFLKHDTLTLGAALAYYTGFSLIPIIIIAISVAGALFGPQAVQGEISRQLEGFVGNQSANQLEELVKVAYIPGKNALSAGIAVIFLIIGACSVFVQIRTSLNVIWNVRSAARRPVTRFLLNRIFSIAMIICMVFLLLVSLTIHAFLAAFMNFIAQKVPNISILLFTAFDILLSFALTSILFALIYKYMSDAKLTWASVWPGAVFTAILFIGGKYLIMIYLSKYSLEDAYGAAGSIVLFLMWVYYSSQIVFFGAEFTHALAIEHGVLLDPGSISSDKDIQPEGKRGPIIPEN